METHEPFVLTPAETCEVLHCSLATINRLVRTGHLHAINKSGVRGRRITLDSVADFKAARNMMGDTRLFDAVLMLRRIDMRLRKLEMEADKSWLGKPIADEPESPVDLAAVEREVRRRHPEFFH